MKLTEEIIISKNNNTEIYVLNEPDLESQFHSNEVLHIHSCGIMPENMPVNSVFSRPNGTADYMINYILNGSFSYNSGKGEPEEYIGVEGGTIVIYKPYEPLCYTRISSKANNYWIHFLGYGASEILENCNLDQNRFYKIKNLQKIQQLFLSILMELQSTDPYKNIKANAYLLDLLCEIARQNAKNSFTYDHRLNNRLLPAIDYMNMHYSSDISVDKLAELCHLSKYYFIRLFKEHTHHSPYSFLTQLRIDNAKELLEKTDLKIRAISEVIGYSDPLYFSKFFKAHTNQTPMQYRDNYKNKQ